VETIRRESAGGNPGELGKALHKLKGSCGTLGAREMFTMVQAIEARLQEGHPEAVPSMLEQLEAALQHTTDALKERA
jgi:HPt (histidine-containing phosphotransfer) domain-containing protein